MHKVTKLLFALFTTAVCLSGQLPLTAAEGPPPCYVEIQTNFFRQDLLATALGIYLVDQSVWIGIFTDLQSASQQVPRIVQELARGRKPNPLYPIFEPNGAAQVLETALFTVFQSVMHKWAASSANILINQDSINGIFRYLWEQQFNNLLLPCLRAYSPGRY